MLDIRTILAIDTIVVLALATALQFYRAHQRTYPGFSLWVLGTWIMAVGYITMVLRGVVADPVNVFITNAAFAGAAVARMDGTLRFTGGRALPRWWYLLPIAAAAACLLPVVYDTGARRSLISGLGVAALSTAIGLRFLRHAPESQGNPYRMIGLLHLVFAVAVGTRSIVWQFEPTVTLLDNRLVHTAFFVTIGVFEACWAIAFTTMNADRLEAELRQAQERLSTTVSELQAALGQVKTLSGLLPVCCSCERIRDDAGYWKELQEYLSDHQGVKFSHGICPECSRKLYPEFTTEE